MNELEIRQFVGTAERLGDDMVEGGLPRWFSAWVELAVARETSTAQCATTILLLKQQRLPTLARCTIAKFTPTH